MASYANAIKWIAENDETSETDPEELRHLISVVMVADLWNKDPLQVAKAVIMLREKKNGKD